jgi:AraC-like DNA-binding protein
MGRVDSYSTDGIEASRRANYWNDRASECIVPLVSEPNDVDRFHGSIRRSAVGGLTFIDVWSEAQVVHHTREHAARTRTPLFFIQLQIQGECSERQIGRETVLGAGDLTLCDTTRAYETSFNGPNRMLMVGVDRDRVRRYVPDPERMTAIPVRARGQVGGLLSSFLVNFWDEYQRGMEPAAAERCILTGLELLGAAYGEIVPGPAAARGLAEANLVRVLSYIESHVNDHDLTVQGVARACRITPRYVHHLFASRAETPADFIMRRRLERCAAALASPAHQHRSVTDIAFAHGFNSQTHFARVFRRKYGATPRDYRRIAPATTSR